MNGLVFESFVGPIGLAWENDAVTAVQLPAGSRQATWLALKQKVPQVILAKPPRHVRGWVRTMTRHLAGDLQKLNQIPIHLLDVPPFFSLIYQELRQVSAGHIITYQQLAERVGRAQAVRAVGQAMRRNPLPLLVPCHRVLAHRHLGGFSAVNGSQLKQHLLQLEHARFSASQMQWDVDEARRILSQRNRKLKRLFDLVGPFNLILSDHKTPYEALFRAIVFQQLHSKAATSILKRVLSLYDRFPAPTELLKTKEEALRAQGLSQNKLRALRDLASKVQDGTVPSRFSIMQSWTDEQIIERLTAVRGIGRWTVEMMLIFRMGRPDIFPTDDFAIRKAYGQIFGEAAPKQMAEAALKWAPYRTLVSWYLYRSLECPALSDN